MCEATLVRRVHPPLLLVPQLQPRVPVCEGKSPIYSIYIYIYVSVWIYIHIYAEAPPIAMCEATLVHHARQPLLLAPQLQPRVPVCEQKGPIYSIYIYIYVCVNIYT